MAFPYIKVEYERLSLTLFLREIFLLSCCTKLSCGISDYNNQTLR